MAKRNYNKKHDVGELPLRLFSKIKFDAKARNLSFEITQEFLWDLYQKQLGECALSGKELNLEYNYKNPSARTASLDRIDSTKGYIEGNVQWIHRDINRMKMASKQEDFVQKCIEVANFHAINKNKYIRFKPL